MRTEAENVLKNLGFLGGVKDFECCGFDFELLRDWYAMKRSIKPQQIAQVVIQDWIDNLFQEVFTPRTELFQLHHRHNDAELSAHGLANETVTILKSTSMSKINLPHDSNIHGHCHSQPNSSKYSGGSKLGCHDGSPISMAIPNLHRHFTDSILKYLPFCSNKNLNPHDNSRAKSEEAAESNQKIGSAFHMNRSINPVQKNSIHHSASNDEAYDWLDRPPIGVTNLLDLFYSSKLHQLIIIDLVALGVTVGSLEVVDDQSRASVDTTEECKSMCLRTDDSNDTDLKNYMLPKPHFINAILLPSRVYSSFARTGRVIERMFEYSDPSKLWSLTFRDSEFYGDFHISLISTLRKCPQICSVSFCSTKQVEDDALLGHLVGQIPSSVKFLSFKSTLSRESIQALCILLKSHNASFIASNDFDVSMSPNAVFLSRQSSDSQQEESKVNGNESKANQNAVRCNVLKGLLGLALTHLSLDNTEINYILNLLQGSSSKGSPAARTNGISKGTHSRTPSFGSPILTTKSSGSGLSTPVSDSKVLKGSSLRGLKYIDLSWNGLSDSNCAKIILAASNGPLEGLELGGNSIHRGVKLIEALDILNHCEKIKLRYLGLSQNNLTTKVVGSIFKCLMGNSFLTHLDLSSNDIEHNSNTEEKLRNFLRINTSLRSLDLCFNKLNSNSFKEIHLGLLENDDILLLPLAGNIDVDKSNNTISLIQIKLRENRLLYKSKSITLDSPVATNSPIKFSEFGLFPNRKSVNSKSSVSDLKAIATLENNEDCLDVNDGNVSISSDKIIQTTTPVPVAVPVNITDGNADVELTTGEVLRRTNSYGIEPHNSKATNEVDSIDSGFKGRPLSTASVALNTLHVLFSAPLAGFDRNSKPHPLEVLDYSAERDILIQVFKEGD